MLWTSAAAIRKLGTLLHEAAHGLAYARKVSDTSRQGRYEPAPILGGGCGQPFQPQDAEAGDADASTVGQPSAGRDELP